MLSTTLPFCGTMNGYIIIRMQLNKVFVDWLHRRHITDSVIEDFGLHTNDDVLVIPIRDFDGSFLYNKYRRSPIRDDGPKYWYDKGGRLELFGKHPAFRDGNEFLVTEGEMDTLVAWSHNIIAVSSTGGAMSFPDVDLSDKSLTLCFDNDPAGGNGMAKLHNHYPTAKILFLPDKPGVKDISDYVTNGGDLPELLKTAKTFPDKESVLADRAERIALWKSTHFHDAYLKLHQTYHPKPIKDRSLMTDELSRAKEYPIENLIHFVKHKAPCIWHKETLPSMTYYPETNSVYCFGCGKHGDAVDVYRQMHNVSFKEAVKALQ